ncbi:hypothetical protein RSAG8_05717, partial [Rhizoctonia solani AG-8 WAC10335]
MCCPKIALLKTNGLNGWRLEVEYWRHSNSRNPNDFNDLVLWMKQGQF